MGLTLTYLLPVGEVFGMVVDWHSATLGDRVAIEPQEYPLIPVDNILGILKKTIGV